MKCIAKKKLKPTGYVAICQCGETVGAIDLNNPEQGAGKILGKWIDNGCELKPKFTNSWWATISPCKCTK